MGGGRPCVSDPMVFFFGEIFIVGEIDFWKIWGNLVRGIFFHLRI